MYIGAMPQLAMTLRTTRPRPTRNTRPAQLSVGFSKGIVTARAGTTVEMACL
jgi:hypothetical protein